MKSCLTEPRGNPYLVGALIGVLSIVTFALDGVVFALVNRVEKQRALTEHNSPL